ncbi:hypothetical protein B0H13DRAFT_2331135 [Mycena leptocephala]|nr:hypothetical protein B0H13DRAFT_2331135 [Mycena leptocephala]
MPDGDPAARPPRLRRRRMSAPPLRAAPRPPARYLELERRLLLFKSADTYGIAIVLTAPLKMRPHAVYGLVPPASCPTGSFLPLFVFGMDILGFSEAGSAVHMYLCPGTGTYAVYVPALLSFFLPYCLSESCSLDGGMSGADRYAYSSPVPIRVGGTEGGNGEGVGCGAREVIGGRNWGRV